MGRYPCPVVRALHVTHAGTSPSPSPFMAHSAGGQRPRLNFPGASLGELLRFVADAAKAEDNARKAKDKAKAEAKARKDKDKARKADEEREEKANPLMGAQVTDWDDRGGYVADFDSSSVVEDGCPFQIVLGDPADIESKIYRKGDVLYVSAAELRFLLVTPLAPIGREEWAAYYTHTHKYNSTHAELRFLLVTPLAPIGREE